MRSCLEDLFVFVLMGGIFVALVAGIKEQGLEWFMGGATICGVPLRCASAAFLGIGLDVFVMRPWNPERRLQESNDRLRELFDDDD